MKIQKFNEIIGWVIYYQLPSALQHAKNCT